MLVISRKRGESIHIGNDIVITFEGNRGDKARIGITAPRSVPVYRAEILERIQAAEESRQEDAPLEQQVDAAREAGL